MSFRGLTPAHQINIVHSDIKPSNILFAVGGNPKIADFGMARSFSKFNDAQFPIGGTDGDVCGTPPYMSPEQASSLSYDCRSDIYSAGAVLYKMLSGEELFSYYKTIPDLSTLASLVNSATPEPLSRFRDDVPRFVEKLMLKMLEKNPDKRPQDAREALKETLNTIAKFKDLCPASAEFWFKPPYVMSPEALFGDIISLLLVDGRITDTERVELAARAEKLGVGAGQARAIERRVRIERGLPFEDQVVTTAEALLEGMISLLLADRGMITKKGRSELVKRAMRLGVGEDQLRSIERRVCAQLGLVGK